MKYLVLFLILFSFTVQADAYLSIPPTPAIKMINGSTGNVTAVYHNSFVSILNTTGILVDFDYALNTITIGSSVSGGGINNTISSIGTQQSIVSGQVLNDHQLKGIACGGDLQCSNNSTDVTISYTGSPAGSSALDDLTDVIITSPAYLSTLFYNGVEWVDRIFTVNSVTCSAGQFVNVINNQTGETTCSTPSGSGNATILSDLGDVSVNNPTYPQILFYNGTQWINKTFALNNQTVQNDFVITGLNNLTGIITTNQFSINTETCSGTNKISAIDNVTGMVTCSADQTGSGGPTSLANNVTSTLLGSAHTEVWTIPLTTNSGNSIKGTIVSTSSVSGAAVQAAANTTASNAYGSCLFSTPLTSTTTALDWLEANSSSVVLLGDTGETAGFQRVGKPVPIIFDCAIITNGTGGNLRIWIQAEVASTVEAKAGSFYIKTP